MFLMELLKAIFGIAWVDQHSVASSASPPRGWVCERVNHTHVRVIPVYL